MKFSTQSIHVGQKPDISTGAIVPPVYLTSTFIQESPGMLKGYDYTRAGNPNFTNLEKTLSALEKGKYATVFSSGSGALTAIASTLSYGDTVIAIDDVYGGTYRLFKQVFEKFGISFKQISFKDLKEVERNLKLKPKIILLESPTNPLLKTVDIVKIARLAKKYNVLTIVDNTFASPYFQQPLTLGADIVLHSSTKYLGGHSDLIGGAIITKDKNFADKMHFARKALGLNPSPFDVWLTSRSLKTLAIRMEKHQENAFAIVKLLKEHSRVKKIYYPGFSGIVSVEFKLSLKQTKKLISSFKVFSLAESLGGAESLVDHPASMTHASIPKKEREKFGLNDGLVRFSVGLEDTTDLIADLRSSLEAVL
ncbi:MAG: PLP-dependent aspartate aminotransferase family protein [bacterium]|nr:PLP-dependent aspartate aminotransferase family protein [bacterium]